MLGELVVEQERILLARGGAGGRGNGGRRRGGFGALSDFAPASLSLWSWTHRLLYGARLSLSSFSTTLQHIVTKPTRHSLTQISPIIRLGRSCTCFLSASQAPSTGTRGGPALGTKEKKTVFKKIKRDTGLRLEACVEACRVRSS